MMLRYKRLLLSLLVQLLAALFLPTNGQTAAELHLQSTSHIESGDWESAVRELRQIDANYHELFVANNLDYLLARLAEQKGQRAEAAINYDAVASRNSPLAPYAFWHQAQLARAGGDLIQEREYLRRLLATPSPGVLREAAMLRLGKSFLESGDFAGVISALRSFAEPAHTPAARESGVLVGRAYLGLGKPAEARATFLNVVMKMPDAARPDDFALAATVELDRIDDKGANLTDADHLLRASIYQFNRDFTGARRHYAAVVTANRQSATVPNALYQIGRGFYQQQNYPEALKYFQQVVDEFPKDSAARDALSFMAATYNRQKRTDEAVLAYRKFIASFPDASSPERSYLNIIDALHEAGRYAEALDWVKQTRSRFPGTLPSALALFAQTRIHLAQGRWSEVVSDTDELLRSSDLGGARVTGGTTTAEVKMLRALAFELGGQIPRAIDTYLEIPDGRNEYYGGRATARLQALAANPGSRSEVQMRATARRAEAETAAQQKHWEGVRRAATDALRLTTNSADRERLTFLLSSAYQALPDYQFPRFVLQPLGRELITEVSAAPRENSLSQELLFLRLFDEAIPEVSREAAQTKDGASDPNRAYSLAHYAQKGGHPNRAVRFAEQVWKNIPSDYLLELAPREMAELLYPVPFSGSALKHASARGLDPRFVLSIARQESRFQTDAKSIAAARGMMQFISATAAETAERLKLQNFTQDALYDPDMALLFGSDYLATLFQQFPDMPQAVAAAYNGGADNIARWIARSRSNDPDRYVAEIGFSQTKDYVWRVLANYRAYQMLYDIHLKRQ